MPTVITIAQPQRPINEVDSTLSAVEGLGSSLDLTRDTGFVIMVISSST